MKTKIMSKVNHWKKEKPNKQLIDLKIEWILTNKMVQDT